MSSSFANAKPNLKISVNQTFGIDTKMEVNGFDKKNEYVPKIDQDYKFDRVCFFRIATSHNTIIMREDKWFEEMRMQSEPCDFFIG